MAGAKTGPKESPKPRSSVRSGAPEWFHGEDGRRLGVLENEHARVRWHEEHGESDPAKEHAGFLAAQLKGVNLAVKE